MASLHAWRGGSLPERREELYANAVDLLPSTPWERWWPNRVADLARSDPARWREVVLLAGAKAARGAVPSVWQLAEALCWREPNDSKSDLADAWGSHLAGQAVVESANLSQVSLGEGCAWEGRPEERLLGGWRKATVA